MKGTHPLPLLDPHPFVPIFLVTLVSTARGNFRARPARLLGYRLVIEPPALPGNLRNLPLPVAGVITVSIHMYVTDRTGNVMEASGSHGRLRSTAGRAVPRHWHQ